MQQVEFLYLSQKDVVEAGLTMTEVIAIAEEVLTAHGHNQFENPPKPGIHPLPGAFIHAMPGYLPRQKAAGMKWVSGFSENYPLGLPNIMGLIVLNDVNSGRPLAVMDGGYITALRTAAVSGVAAKHLAKADAKVVGIVGAGVQGRYNLLSLKAVLPGIQTVNIFDTQADILNRFVAVMAAQVPYEIRVCDSAREVIEDADVIVTATGHLEDRIYKEAWLQDDVLILPVHTRGWEQTVLKRADKFVVDDWTQFNNALGGEDGYYAPLPDLYAQLGEIVAGAKQGRTGGPERVVNINFGMAIQDVLLATRVLEKARKKGLGTMLPLIEDDIPLM